MYAGYAQSGYSQSSYSDDYSSRPPVRQGKGKAATPGDWSNNNAWNEWSTGGDGQYNEYNEYNDRNNGWDSYQSGNYQSDTRGGAEYESRFPGVAQKLSQLRDRLPVEAAQAYHALQLALQPHSRPQGSGPQFDQDFHSNLSMLFPNARDIKVRQIGAMNQWEVRIDHGPKIFCSVRLEVLSDDPNFTKELKAKARVVKDTLLDNGGKWKRDLLPGLGGHMNHFEKMSQFEQECRDRAVNKQRGGGDGTSGNPRSRSAWNDEKEICQICKKSTEEDQLAGQHMCVVFAFFQCGLCQDQREGGRQAQWTSYRARLHPDGYVMGQNCSSCGAKGEAKDWRVMPASAIGDDESMISRRSGARGMHQAELCDACREFGNCMGVFYDPFILTTALSMLSGHYVQWSSFSEEMPELLVADMGPDFSNVQVCLQPHVYIKPEQEEAPYEMRPSMHTKGRGNVDRRDPFGHVDNDSFEQSVGQSSVYGREEDVMSTDMSQDGAYMAPQRFVRDTDFEGSQRSSGGVRDSSLLNAFVNQGTSVSSRAPPSGAGGYAASVGSSASEQLRYAPRGIAPSVGGTDVFSYDAYADGTMSERSYANSTSMLSQSVAEQSVASYHGPAEDSVPKVNKLKKMNKIQPSAPSSSDPSMPTPFLDQLPPLRRAQFLQVVLRQVKQSGGTEADKLGKAEEYLVTYGGDYDKAYKHVKSLTGPI